MDELTPQFLMAFLLVALALLAVNRIAAGTRAAPLAECIEHGSCSAAAQAHGRRASPAHALSPGSADLDRAERLRVAVP
ncbi:hypothetical protein [Longivirga aurantiaca]|uniref:Secreted protein n=1 Tax=Longivirga aurantiaca TaxID=1837743 RepID=A0ABW1T0G8_9ACTN